MPTHRLRLPLALGLLVFCVFSLTSSTHPYGYEGPTISYVERTLFGTGAGLKEDSVAGLVDRLAYVPFVIGKHTLAPGRGESLRRIAYVLVQPSIATLVCLALYGLARQVRYRRSTAARLVLVAAGATMLWPYSKFGMENHQTLWTVAGTWLFLRYAMHPSAGRAALAAAALGTLALTKLSGVLHAAVLFAAGAALVLRLGAGRWPSLRRDLAIGLAVGAAALAILLVSNRLIYGGWLLGGRYEIGIEYSPRLWWNSALGLLVGPGKSLFVFNPPLLLGAALLPRFLRRSPELRPFAWALLALTLFYVCGLYWFFEESWGPRRMHFLVPFLVLPLGLWLDEWKTLGGRKRILAGGLLALGVGTQVLAVCFSYAAHPWTLRRHPSYSMEGITWNPRLNALVFNAHLLRSLLSRATGGPSLPFVIEDHYIPWNSPHPVPRPRRFDVSREDHLDFWWEQERVEWSKIGGDFWFDQDAAWVAILLFAGALTGGVSTARAVRRPGS